MNLSHWPIGARLVANVAYLTVCIAGMLLVVLVPRL